MIKITFEANSVAELRSVIAEYLGASIAVTLPVKEETPKKRTPKDKSSEPEVESPPVEEAVSTITIEDIRTLVLSGQIPKAKVKGLLGNFGVERITEVPETDYAIFFEQLSALKGE